MRYCTRMKHGKIAAAKLRLRNHLHRFRMSVYFAITSCTWILKVSIILFDHRENSNSAYQSHLLVLKSSINFYHRLTVVSSACRDSKSQVPALVLVQTMFPRTTAPALLMTARCFFILMHNWSRWRQHQHLSSSQKSPMNWNPISFTLRS